MAFLSPTEDFVESVGCMSGPLSQLDYIESLRDEAGAYSHWGLERVHGAIRAREAIAITRIQVQDKILQTRIALLWKELADGALRWSGSVGELWRRPSGRPAVDRGAGYRERHLAFLFHALEELALADPKRRS